MNIEVSTNEQGLMPVEVVQKVVNRSRASVYRYANTDPSELNPPYDPQRLNPELRRHKDEPLLFHPSEVARFASDVLGMRQVTIAVQQPPKTPTQEMLRAIWQELQEIRQMLERQQEQL